MENEQRMKKADLMKEYHGLVDSGKEVDMVILYIHMPGGETEIIVNPAVEAKMAYIDKTYNEDLVHNGCQDIYITEAIFSTADEGMDFGSAVSAMRDGDRVTRAGWNGKGMWIELCTPDGDWKDPDGNTYGRRPYIYMKAADDTLVPWVASQTDILAEDWQVVPVDDPEEDPSDE